MSKKPKKKWKLFIKHSRLILKLSIIWSLVAIFVFFLAILGLGIYYYLYKTPSPQEIIKKDSYETTVIFDRTGKHILYQLYGEENRKILKHEEIPDIVRAATIVAEDKSFYNHWGVDLLSSLRALKVNLFNQEKLQGGSTITQQLVRNWFLSREKTYKRKFVEIIMAFKMERFLTKDEILDAYLNEVPYGSNAYGIQSAAEVFFAKDAKDLTLDEAAMLAALPKATTYFSPYGKHKHELVKRTRKIIEDMAVEGYISREQALEFLKVDVLSKVVDLRRTIIAPHFVFFVIEELKSRYGEEMLRTAGLKVYTTLDYEMQKKSEETLLESAEAISKLGASNAALVAIDPKSGDILAMAGSIDYFSESSEGQFNAAVSLRQPGSAFKPIVYAAAFEKGFQPETLIADKETNFGKDGSGRNYMPKNYDGKYHGILPMRNALAMSLNIPAVKTLSLVGINSGVDMARRLGISNYQDSSQFGLSMAIGGYEVRLLDLVGAFSVFANDGKKCALQSISRIIRDENVFFIQQKTEEQVIDSEVARKINSVLSDNNARAPVFGINNPLSFPGRQVAAKTGTSQDFRDAWTIGYIPHLAAGVWVGNNNGSHMKQGSDGIYAAAPVWRKFMDKVIDRFPKEDFPKYKFSPKGNLSALDPQDQKAYDKCNRKSEKKREKCLREIIDSEKKDKDDD